MRKLLAMTLLSLAATLAQAADAALRSDLTLLAEKRMYFAHQSVGANLLEGVAMLSREAGVPLRIQEASNAAGLAPGTLAHFFVPENGDPLGKLANFKKALGGGSAADIALIKFCYVDIDAATDASALFAHYQETLAELRAANPRTTFVHVTLPLTTAQSGWKALAKRLLGRAPYGTIENVRREQYNALMRRAYVGREPLFDLARIESTAPDGSAVTVAWAGAVAPAMASAYTDDGGHLNEKGRRVAARALLAVLAQAARPLQKIDGFVTPVRISR
ncbi:MAG: SGNH/GDSL hydrolase family protein [Betaproteobacteria bacterium]|nr:SGNH/GDSL hydrolase family protein [Betaproteobacteria bacterium]